MKRETFHLAIYFTDGFLHKTKNLPLGDYQLLGASAVFLATKIEEIYSFRIVDVVGITDNGYTAD